jgi:uncharacterized membrane protein YgdD (TMEM256/DUF423 family)
MSDGKLFLVIGSACAALGVILGAFGAHALKSRLPETLLAAWQTGVLYHLVHSLGLMVIGAALLHFPASALIRASGWLMLAGIVLFSGSLYLLSAAGMRWLGPATPVGGAAFILAWLLFAAGIVRSSP